MPRHGRSCRPWLIRSSLLLRRRLRLWLREQLLSGVAPGGSDRSNDSEELRIAGVGDDAGAGTILAGIWAFVNEVCRAMPRSQLDLHHRQRLPRQGVRLDPPGVAFFQDACYFKSSWNFSVSTNPIICLGAKVPSNLYPPSSHDYLSLFPLLIPTEELFAEMDRVWFDCLNNHDKVLSDKFFADFYSHPVWCLNSVFSSVDPASVHNREALIEAIRLLSIEEVADMGGGYGVFLQMLKESLPSLRAILCEPYIDQQIESEFAKKNIEVVKQTPTEVGAYVFIDVLEHLVEPLKYLKEILSVAKPGSYFMFGNCFYPFIKCHLPSTFYLRHTFIFAAGLMGLKYISDVKEAEYIQIFQLRSNTNVSPRTVALLARVKAMIISINSLMAPFNLKLRRAIKKLLGLMDSIKQPL